MTIFNMVASKNTIPLSSSIRKGEVKTLSHSKEEVPHTSTNSLLKKMLNQDVGGKIVSNKHRESKMISQSEETDQ